MWDVGGRGKIRLLYQHYYYKKSHGVIWIVDSNDLNRLDQSLDEIHRMTCEEKDLVRIPILILCNKQDLPHALLPMEINERLGSFENSW